MTTKITIRISAAAAPYAGADKPREDRLRAASGKVPLPPTDFVLLLYYLCHDPDQEVKRLAVGTLRSMDATFVAGILADPALPPVVLDALVQLHGKCPELATLFAGHPNLSEKAAAWLAAQGSVPEVPASAAATGQEPQRRHDAAAEASCADDEEVDEVDEERFQSKFQMAQELGVSEKIKIAMTGDKEWRNILIKDNNKLVSGAAIKNPRMTEAEVLAIVKSTVQNDEILRVICANKEWIKNAQIRKALVENNKTPLPNALRFLGTLGEKDLASLAKSKNINTVLATQARKIYVQKKEKR